MSNLVDGIKYDYAENIAERFDYSVFHIRHLAREYKNGDKEKGLKAFKYKGRWAVSVADAQKKLQPVDIDEMESLESDESGQRTQSKPVETDTDWLDEL